MGEENKIKEEDVLEIEHVSEVSPSASGCVSGETGDSTSENQQDLTNPPFEKDECVSEDSESGNPPAEDSSHEMISPACPQSDVDSLNQIDERLDKISETEQKLFSEVREIHKLYHTEFAGRLRSMQGELDHYHKLEKDRVYDDILASIARIFLNYETLADEVSDPKAKKSIRYLFMDIEDLLSQYGMTRHHSSVGEKRNPRYCQVLNRIPTDKAEKHDTVAKSYSSGFFIGNHAVMKEIVDIYFFEEQVPIEKTDEEKNVDAGDVPVHNMEDE